MSAINDEIGDLARDAEASLVKVIKDSAGDPEWAHAAADDILCEVLRRLGYNKLIDLYEDVEKWYA